MLWIIRQKLTNRSCVSALREDSAARAGARTSGSHGRRSRHRAGQRGGHAGSGLTRHRSAGAGPQEVHACGPHGLVSMATGPQPVGGGSGCSSAASSRGRVGTPCPARAAPGLRLQNQVQRAMARSIAAPSWEQHSASSGGGAQKAFFFKKN